MGDKSKIGYESYFRAYQKFLVKNADLIWVKRIYKFFNQRVFAGVNGAITVSDDDPEEFNLDDELEEAQQEVLQIEMDGLTLDDPSDAAATTSSAIGPPADSSIVQANDHWAAATPQSSEAAEVAEVSGSGREMEPIPEEDEVELVESAPTTKPRPKPRPKPTPKASKSSSKSVGSRPVAAGVEVDIEESEDVGRVGVEARGKQTRSTRSATKSSR